MPLAPAIPALHGLTVLERGWLSSNNILIHDRAGAVLVDSGHCVHAAQTVALVRHALQGARLARVINTHLHSDHCGGNAALQHAFDAAVSIPPWLAGAVAAWDEEALSYGPTGQRCERFTAHDTLAPGNRLRLGGRVWEVLAAPGHDPASVMLFDSTHGLLLSADALWENGFGVVFPQIEGRDAWDEVAAALDLVERLPVSAVVPGHGPAFTGVAEALARARRRLAVFRAEPVRHAHYAAKALLTYHVMEHGPQPLEALRRWVAETPLMELLRAGSGPGPAQPADEWTEALLLQLRDRGVLACDQGMVSSR
jgi:glyoxylase-like metal-dependent hydrolase (beta-lactamase superfamily II)